MTIPTAFQSSNYPDSLDNDQNLFLVHDSLKVVLATDYNPTTDTTIVVEGDISLFPATGIITLTEQCSEIGKRAISFYYTSHTVDTFSGLTPLDGFDNTIVRAKKRTYVTQNVMDRHHNSLKDALIAIQEFVGVKGTTDTQPFGETMEGRINFLRKLVLSPRAWFTANKRNGLIPLEVTFKNESFRLGDGNVTVTWDFGDASSSIALSSLSTISVTSVTPISTTDVRVVDIDSGEIIKVYDKPQKYTVKLTIENEFGSDSVEFEDFITARIEAPDEAIIEFSNTTDQIFTAGTPSDGPYEDEDDTPKIRSRINKFINLTIPEGIHSTTLRTYSGEEVVGDDPIDPVITYTWLLNDDFEHPDSRSAVASYSIGGLYDLVLRCDTEFGAYRITTYKEAFDIVEDKNMWLFTNPNSVNTTYANEFGLISETFKTGTTPYTIRRDWGFLNDTNNEEQAVQEFKRNVKLAPNSIVSSGNAGTSLLAYAGGCGEGDPLSSQQIRIVEFEGFAGTLSENPIAIYRPWNWVFLPFFTKGYFLYGPDSTAVSDTNDSSAIKDTLNMSAITLSSPTTLTLDNYINGAEELREHVTSDYEDGEPENGRFAVYRSTVRDSVGYFLRNSGVGEFFKIRDFYRTEGTSANPVTNITKLADMSGQVKTNGELVSLSNGLFFFNNSGNINAYNISDGVWETANTTISFRNYQDTTLDGYDDKSNSLLACSDGDRNAYLSYDYSTKAFLKYNSVDFTFSLLGERPAGEQWVAEIY